MRNKRLNTYKITNFYDALIIFQVLTLKVFKKLNGSKTKKVNV